MKLAKVQAGDAPQVAPHPKAMYFYQNQNTMKVYHRLMIFSVFILTGLVAKSQVVYGDRMEKCRQDRLRISEYTSEADVVVFRTEWKSDAKPMSGIWYFTEWKSDADLRIYFTEWRK